MLIQRPLPTRPGPSLRWGDGSGRRDARPDEEHALLLVRDLDLAAAFLEQAVDQPGGGAARGDRILGDLAEQGPLQLGVEDDARAVSADDDVDAAAMLLG